MNAFDKRLMDFGAYPLNAEKVDTLQINMGSHCNLSCTHCHVDASPDRKDMMSLTVIAIIMNILRENDEITTVDITGGSPELNPYFGFFVDSCSDIGNRIIVRSNLAIYTEKGKEDIPQLLADNKVKTVGSLPCYSEKGVDSQRGKGTYEKAISALKHLNELGYGKEGTGLEIDIMFNPAREGIAPDQQMLEKTYKKKLFEMHGIIFNRLITLSNMPIGRLGKSMSIEDKSTYINELRAKFNPETINNLMCRRLISVSHEGVMYDCDFWQMLNLPINNGGSDIARFDYGKLKNREIVTNPLCFICTAGEGSSCGGALVEDKI